jgi:hypothetical protein
MTKLPEALIPTDDFLRSGLIFIVAYRYFSLDLRCTANISAFVSSSLSLNL